MSFRWACPYCNHSQIVSNENHFQRDLYLNVGYEEEQRALKVISVRCLNTDCNKMFLRTLLYKAERVYGAGYEPTGEPIEIWTLMPDGRNSVVHESVPQAIKEDYEEACRIVSRSPKAAATLIRRCLQGMIRDFCGVRGSRLIDEIKILLDNVNNGTAPREVSIDSVNAIDKVRKIGNIGAHMEKDVNVIVDIDAGEADILIELVETLFEDWYMERFKRQKRFAEISRISEEKDALKKLPAS